MGLEGIIRVIVAFGFVLALVLFTAWVVKKLGLEKRLRARFAKEGDGVQVEDIFYLDNKRRLVTIARGRQKHLLLLGPHTDMVLENFEEDPKNSKELHSQATRGDDNETA